MLKHSNATERWFLLIERLPTRVLRVLHLPLRRSGILDAAACILLLTSLVIGGGVSKLQGSQKPPGPSHSTGSAEFQRLAKQASEAREANRISESIDLYLKALKLNPKWEEGWWYLGTLNYDSDHYAEGASAFHNLVELLPDYGSGWAMLGLCEFELGDYKNSYIHIQKGRAKGLGDNKDLVNVVRYHQALIENLNGNFDSAFSLLSSLVTQNVLSNDVKLAMGIALLHVPLLPKQIDPSKDALISAAGNIGELEALNDFDSAKKAFEQLIHDYPTTPFVHFAYGSMLADLSVYKEAEEQLEEEIKINPGSSMPYMQLAYVYIRVNQFKDALPLSRKAVELAPQSFAAHYLLGRALLGMGQVNESIDELIIAKRLGPYSPDVRYNLARALARAKRFREATQEQAEFERLNSLVQKAQREAGPESYRNSSSRGGSPPKTDQEPPASGPPQ
jgi:tetratricopeptide (TPR) repeat protein